MKVYTSGLKCFSQQKVETAEPPWPNLLVVFFFKCFKGNSANGLQIMQALSPYWLGDSGISQFNIQSLETYTDKPLAS